MQPFIIPDAKPEISVKAPELKVGQSLVMWTPTFSRRQNLSPITKVTVRNKTTLVEYTQGSLKVVGIAMYKNDQEVVVVE